MFIEFCYHLRYEPVEDDQEPKYNYAGQYVAGLGDWELDHGPRG